MTTKLSKKFEFQIQYAAPDSEGNLISGRVETLSCSDDREFLHEILDELLDKSMQYPQPKSHDENLQTIFWVRGAGCDTHN